MVTQNRMKIALILAAVAMMFLVLDAAADIPAELPDPDTTPPDTTKPVKVFILSGQSNMVGIGYVNGTKPGSLETITKTDGLFPHMLDAAGNWTVRNDVWYEGVVTATAKKWLTIGCGSGADKIGPELQFGHIMGYYHDEPVIILKTSQGNRALGWDFLPPGSVGYTEDGWTFPGYGESPEKWLEGTTPAPIAWYAGKQYDDCVAAAKDVLDNFNTKFPQWADQGYEIAGFAWWQGHRDALTTAHANHYELNMVNFIKAFRAEFDAPNAPFVIATIAFGGWTMSGNQLTVANAQLAVSGETGNYPEFEGNVKTVECRDYWKSTAESPGTQGHHYNNNAWTYMMVGDVLGRAMAEILTPYSVDAGPDMITWSGEPVTLDATVQEGVAVVSYAWSAENPTPRNTAVVFDSSGIEDPTVTISKAAGDPVSVALTLTVDDGENPPVTDIMTIKVYDDACEAARLGMSLAANNPADFNRDCKISLEDLVRMAAKWLNDTGLTVPQPK